MITICDEEFDQTVERALAELPDEFATHLKNVVIEVRPRPDAAFQREHDVPGDLLGLYAGVPLDEQGYRREHAGPLPDRIYIFRENLCAACASREELTREIRVTLLHEIGHHFGLDEDRLAELGYD